MERPQKKRGNEKGSAAAHERAFRDLRGARDPLFEGTVNEGIARAHDLIHKRFEDTDDETTEAAKGPYDNLEFHNTKHTEDVERRIRAILQAMQASERHVLLGALLGAYHDTVQEYVADTKSDGSVMRKRHIGVNETKSAEELATFMRARPTAFTEEEIAIVDPGMQNTVPGFDPELKAVVQPNFLKSINNDFEWEHPNDSLELVKRALALADLGTAGMDGPDKFLPEGNAVFREENLDVPELLNKPEARKFLTDRMLAWSKGQITFAETRKALLDRELKGLPEKMADEVRKLFSKFGDSIKAATDQLATRKQMTFEELVASFGYTPPKYTLQ